MSDVKRTIETAADDLPTLPPDAWQGEVDCVVGPFPSRASAQKFVNFEVGFDPEKAVVDAIFVRGNVWYVELRRLRWA